MSVRNEQCEKVCKILDDALANRPSERDTLIVAVQKAFDALADDGWIPYTGHDQNIEYGRYLVQTKESMVCGTYGLEGFVFPFYVERIVAFRPLPPAFRPKEDK